MFKKPLIVIALIFIIMLGLNCLTPMCYGDDYVYAFIWPHQSMFIPLPETVERVNSIRDVLVSQWSHYFTGNGRVVAHVLVQFFIWLGKPIFNVVNALIFVLLILEIYWISVMGDISFKNLRAGALCWIFFILWSFIAGFGTVYLWISGSCNYLWMLAVLLSFLILYIQKYYQMDKPIGNARISAPLIFIWGVIAGWSNENTVCWVILILGIWLYKCKKNNKIEKWMAYGFIGLCVGYILLIFAPGNAVRASYYVENSINIFSPEMMKYKLMTFGQLEVMQAILWYFTIKSFLKIEYTGPDDAILKRIKLAKLFCLLSVLTNIIMLFAPEFRPRSGFPSLVFLIIGASILIRLQEVLKQDFIDIYAKRFLLFVGGCYFLTTLVGTFWGMNMIYQYDKSVIEKAQRYSRERIDNILLIPEPPEISDKLTWSSGFHLIGHKLPKDEKKWQNVAFSRYYGIKGIRTVKEEYEEDKSEKRNKSN